MNNLPKIKVFETINGQMDYIVLECSEDKWNVCIMCRYFGNCQLKSKNRVGLIPNLLDDIRKIKVKFLMGLKNHDGNKNK